MCASGSFKHPTLLNDPTKFCHMMVWVFGKLYRREFLDKYNIRFNDTRANEDSGFNRIVLLLCDNPEEQIRFVEENMYNYNKNEDSITNINGDYTYFFDQGACGVIDNMIYAIGHVRKYKPFSEMALREIVSIMAHTYFQYVTILDKAPGYSIQYWEYAKKYYHHCYKQIENYVTDAMFKYAYSINQLTALRNYGFGGIIPKMTIIEFMRKLRSEEYDPNLIYEIQEEMKNDSEFRQVINNNISCGGVCASGYADKTMKEV